MATSKPDKILRRIKKLKHARDTIQGEIDILIHEWMKLKNPKNKINVLGGYKRGVAIIRPEEVKL